jgi:hypothetical protein
MGVEVMQCYGILGYGLREKSISMCATGSEMMRWRKVSLVEDIGGVKKKLRRWRSD